MFTFFLLFVMIGVSVFGFFLMAYGGHHVCPVSLLFPSSCPTSDTGLAVIIHHLTGLRELFLAPVVSFPGSLAALGIFFFSMVIFFIRGAPHLLLSRRSYTYTNALLLRFRRALPFSLMHWLARRNKGDVPFFVMTYG